MRRRTRPARRFLRAIGAPVPKGLLEQAQDAFRAFDELVPFYPKPFSPLDRHLLLNFQTWASQFTGPNDWRDLRWASAKT